jgi:hypothetical protein
MTLRPIRLLLTILIAIAGPTAMTASARPRRHHSPLVLHLGFRGAGTATAVTAEGRYVLVSGAYSAANGTPDTLIDERTGTETSVSYPGCSPVALGEPWLVYTCAPDYGTMELYALPTGGWTAVTLHAGYSIGWSPIAIGARWIQLQEFCADGPSHCLNSYAFQNLQTGNITPDPTSATTYADLNSPTLARRVCKPLHVPMVDGPEGEVIYAAQPGALAFYGKFAISSSGMTGAHGFLERCGSRLHRQIGLPNLVGAAFAASSHFVVWQSGQHQLGGLFLPSLRRFVIPLPAGINTQSSNGIGFPGTIAASSRHLYLLNSSDTSSIRSYWIAPLPSLRRHSK